MIVAVDVNYGRYMAYAAGILFTDWSSEVWLDEIRESLAISAAYEPGSFYKRELPVLLKLVGRVIDEVELAIVDGYVWLAPDNRPGLGAHLFEAFGGRIAVIGVAKGHFRGASNAQPVYRGRSRRPLYVTSAGMDQSTAAAHVGMMHGGYRIPTLLKAVDRLCRSSKAVPDARQYSRSL